MKRHDLYKRGRSCSISCLSFGENRKAEYPDCFFCHSCDLLEDAVRNGAKRAHRQQKKYMCTAGHTNLSYPSTTKKQYRPNVKTPSTATTPGRASVTQHYQEEHQESIGMNDILAFNDNCCLLANKPLQEETTPRGRRNTRNERNHTRL